MLSTIPPDDAFSRRSSDRTTHGNPPRGGLRTVGRTVGDGYGMIAMASISTSAPGRACVAVETTVIAVR